jgi:hypothetical protein
VPAVRTLRTSREGLPLPSVSVVTSTHQRPDLLARTVASVLRQTMTDLEHVIVDNGSGDDTWELLSRIDDPRVRVVRNEVSLGPTGGRNTGLAAARGDLVAFLDDDDVWAPNRLEAGLRALEEGSARWSYAGCVYIDRDDRVIGGRPAPSPTEVVEDLPSRYAVPGGISGLLWERDALDGDGLLDPRLQLTSDWDLALRLLRSSAPAAVLAPVVGYRQHATNVSRRAGDLLGELDVLREKFTDLGVDRQLDPALLHRFVGSEATRAGHRRDAARAFARAVRLGDSGSFLRAPGVLLPSGVQVRARRLLFSDARWLAAAEPWLADLRETPAPW